MEAIAFFGSRQVNLRAVFTKSTSPQETGDYTSALRALSHTLEKQIRTWWDISTLEMYLSENIISRGLRWDVAPQDGLDDEQSQKEWLEFFNKCGRDLQALILKRKVRKMTLIEEKIKALQVELEPVKNEQSTKDFNENIRKRLEKLDKDTQKKKVKKFNRDLGDFNSNCIYAWQANPLGETQEEMQGASAPGTSIPGKTPKKGQNIRKGVQPNTPKITNKPNGVTMVQPNPYPPQPNPYPRNYGGNNYGNDYGPREDEWRKVTNRGRGRSQYYPPPDRRPVDTYNYYQPLENYVPNTPRGNGFLGRGRGRGRGRHRPPFNGPQGDREYYRELAKGEEDAEPEEGSKGKKRRRT